MTGDPSELFARAIPDPTDNLSEGDQLHFVSGVFPLETMGARQRLADWRSFEGALLALGFKDNDEILVEGSATMVAPGLALAASHVVGPWWDVINQRGIVPFVAGFCSWGLQLWSVTHINRIRTTDLALLSLRPASALPPDMTFRQATLTTRVPQVGEPVLVAGFRSRQKNTAIVEGKARISGEALVAAGTVLTRYPMKRDTVMLPFPVLEIDCSVVGGMSGGPVFDKEGLLIGVISSSIESDDDTGPSYASLLYPAFGWRVPTLWPPGLLRNPTALIEIDPQLCPIERRHALHVEFDGSGDSYRLALDVSDAQ